MQSMAWKHVSFSPPRKFLVVASARKDMTTVFWDAEGIVVIDYLEHDSTITGIYYADLTRKARAALKKKRRGKLRHGMLFHQDNAPAYMSSQALAVVRNVGFELLPHRPYLPDLTQSDFYLCPTLMIHSFMKGWKFADDKDAICTANGWLEDQDQSIFYNVIRALEKCWTKGFQSKETMLKSDKMWRAYLMVNCVRLWTFWMPLVLMDCHTFFRRYVALKQQW